MDKVTWWHLQSTAKEVILPKIVFNYMHGSKSAILTIFQKSADWLDWLCPISTALQNGSQDIFFPFIFYFPFFLDMKPLSKVAPCLLVIQIQIQAVCEVIQPEFSSEKKSTDVFHIIGPPWPFQTKTCKVH